MTRSPIGRAGAGHVTGPRVAVGTARELEPLLTTRDLAHLLRLHSKTVERMARAGRLPSLRVFGRLRYRSSDIASWLAAKEDRACHDT